VGHVGLPGRHPGSSPSSLIISAGRDQATDTVLNAPTSQRSLRPLDDRCAFLGGHGLTLSNGIKTRVSVLDAPDASPNVIISTTPDSGRDGPITPAR
jgi:hypothetical protein